MKNLIITISRNMAAAPGSGAKSWPRSWASPTMTSIWSIWPPKRSGLTPEFIEKDRAANTGGIFYGTNTWGAVGSVLAGGTSLRIRSIWPSSPSSGKLPPRAAASSWAAVPTPSSGRISPCLTVFLHADLQKRIERAILAYGIDTDKAERVGARHGQGPGQALQILQRPQSGARRTTTIFPWISAPSPSTARSRSSPTASVP